MKQVFITDMELLQALLQQLERNELTSIVIIDQLQQWIDSYSEQGFIGLADALALVAEQLEQLPPELEDDQRVLLDDCGKALLDLANVQQPAVWQYLLASLTDSRWPEPVDEEDCGFLAELLQQDVEKLWSEEELVSAETEGSPVQTQPTIIANILQRFSESGENLEDIADNFHDIADKCSEDGFSGISDLLALSAELLESGGETSLSGEYLPLLINVLSAREVVETESLLQLMSDSRWNEPLPSDDREFLAEILMADFQRLSPLTFGLADIAPERVEATVPALQQSPVQPLLQPFCDIDFSLLEQPGPAIDPDVLAMLTATLQQLEPLWLDEAETTESLLAISLQQLEPVQRALQTLHLHGALFIVQGIRINLEYLAGHPRLLESGLKLQIAAVFRQFILYFDDITDQLSHQQLLDQLLLADLPGAPSEEQAGFIRGLLALASIEFADLLEPEVANAGDLQLQVSDDIDPQLLDMLFDELPQQSEQLISHLQHDNDLQELRSAQRISHTIKGLANMAGIAGLASLTHRLEDILELLTEAGQLPGSALAETVLAAADTIAAMSDAVVANSPAPQGSVQLLQQLMDWHYQLRNEGVALAAAELQSGHITESAAETDTVANVAKEMSDEFAGSLLVDSLPDNSPSGDSLQPDVPDQQPLRQEQVLQRVPQATLDSLLRLTGESSTLSTQLDEEITQLRSYSRIGRDRQRALQRIMFELEQQLNEYYTLQPELDRESSEFDPLEMDRYSEMHTSLSRLQEAAADIREVEDTLDKHIRRTGELHIAQSGLQKETLDRVLSTRLVEVKTMTNRMQRILRQACRASGKDAVLEIEGEHTRIDSQILDQLADPLMHIIRNAVDHGLETAQQRLAKGKPEQGRLTLSFRLDNDLVRVTCSDDGAGIDTLKVRQVASDKQLIDADTELSEQELQRLILVPGFSTSDQISQLSGRGIGMDVVYQQVMRLQGSLDIRSAENAGTTFELSMPANSLMVKTLLVRAGKQIYALSSHGLEQSLISLDGQLIETEQGAHFTYADQSYPAYPLESLVAEAGKPYAQDQVFPVLLVNMGQGERVAVLVREVIAHRELAFKDMGDYIPDIPGIPGLTILANGDTAPIVDLPARIRHKLSVTKNLFRQVDHGELLSLPKLLVVDDSISARSSLSTLLRDTGYEVRTAIDGLDALNQIRKDSPDLVLTDLEMPRMTGMELAAMIQSRQEMQHIPVMMITSRTTERHQREAGAAGVASFITKPWTESGLLQQVESLLQPQSMT
ncbi:hybrid sensor histidine kinase/response regulator [Amphritea sp. HPY]|uniref:hybrid sensor histidine kinase/response regulator n=1 Tax=Amphritea sp. HPY TaxID=3421652 RepID=UPI003D7EC882